MRTHRLCRGFSLIELLLVASLMLIILGLTLPSLLRSRIAANEGSAISTLRVLHGAEHRYAGAYNSFSSDFNSLGPPAASAPPSDSSADLVDVVLAGRVSGTATTFVKAGYRFTYVPSGVYPSVRSFDIHADPISRGATGQRSFYMDQSGVIRANSSSSATASDLPAM